MESQETPLLSLHPRVLNWPTQIRPTILPAKENHSLRAIIQSLPHHTTRSASCGLSVIVAIVSMVSMMPMMPLIAPMLAHIRPPVMRDTLVALAQHLEVAVVVAVRVPALGTARGSRLLGRLPGVAGRRGGL